MLSREENDYLTQTDSGTSMGAFMRRFWTPFMLSREISEPDGAPVRVRVLGESLIAFRDTEGRVGLVDEFCPHRRVSLFFGRNEACGILRRKPATNHWRSPAGPVWRRRA